MSETENTPSFFEQMREHAPRVINSVPYAQALGVEIMDIQRGQAWAKAPYREETIGDADTGVIHGGVITALLDNLAGVAVVSKLDKPMSTATLDLRIDYMRPATPGRDVIGEAECYHVTKTVAFVRAWAYHDSKEKVIATAAGAFALNDFRLSGTAERIKEAAGNE